MRTSAIHEPTPSSRARTLASKAALCIRQHTSAYTSAFVSIRQSVGFKGSAVGASCVSIGNLVPVEASKLSAFVPAKAGNLSACGH